MKTPLLFLVVALSGCGPVSSSSESLNGHWLLSDGGVALTVYQVESKTYWQGNKAINLAKIRTGFEPSCNMFKLASGNVTSATEGYEILSVSNGVQLKLGLENSYVNQKYRLVNQNEVSSIVGTVRMEFESTLKTESNAHVFKWNAKYLDDAKELANESGQFVVTKSLSCQ